MDLTIKDKETINILDEEILRLTLLIDDFSQKSKMIIKTMLQNIAFVITLNIAYFIYTNYYNFNMLRLTIIILMSLYPIYRIGKGVYAYILAKNFMEETKENIKEYKVMKEIILIEGE